MKDKLTQIGLIIGTLAGLVITGIHTVNIGALTLPPEQIYIAYIALVFFEGGTLLWFRALKHGARGSWQRAIAFVMLIISFVGVGLTTIADSFLQAEVRGLLENDTNFARSIIVAITMVVVINVIAYLGFELTDPETLREMAERDAQDTISDKALEQIKRESQSLAAELRDQIAGAWRTEMRARYATNPLKPHQDKPDRSPEPSLGAFLQWLRSAFPSANVGGNGHQPAAPAGTQEWERYDPNA